MKKSILFAVLAALLLGLAACGAPAAETPEITEQEPEVIPGVPNPMVQYDTLDDINGLVGSRLCAPGVMGVTDKAYFVINTGDGKMAEEQFTVAGNKYNFRCAPVDDRDISGLWIGDGGTAFEGMEPSDEIQYAESDSCKAARWFTKDGQYVLSVNDEGRLTEDDFLAVAGELRAGTQPD